MYSRLTPTTAVFQSLSYCILNILKFSIPCQLQKHFIKPFQTEVSVKRISKWIHIHKSIKGFHRSHYILITPETEIEWQTVAIIVLTFQTVYNNFHFYQTLSKTCFHFLYTSVGVYMKLSIQTNRAQTKTENNFIYCDTCLATKEFSFCYQWPLMHFNVTIS